MKITNEMVLAFHHSLSDGAIGKDEMEEIRGGLQAALGVMQASLETADSSYAIIQEGGASGEFYVHMHDSPESAHDDRIACARRGSYRTSPVIEIPGRLLAQPEFAVDVQAIIDRTARATLEISYPVVSRPSSSTRRGR